MDFERLAIKDFVVGNKGVRLLVSLCRELQEMAGDQPFMLHQRSVAKLFGRSDHRTFLTGSKSVRQSAC